MLVRFCYKAVQVAVIQNHENVNGTLAKEKLNKENIKGSNVVAVKHTTD
jgi:hypothetical protein